jgi:tryptophan-rich sensory protein
MMKIIKLIVSVAVCELAGVVGALFTTSQIPTWYAALNKPSFNPPNWLFGPVWTLLYLLMGVAAYTIWQQGFDHSSVKRALAVFLVQLVLNVLWSFVFFGLESVLGGLVVIILLWSAIFLTISLFLRQSRMAGWLLIPYIVWVTFATVLNAAIFALNI